MEESGIKAPLLAYYTPTIFPGGKNERKYQRTNMGSGDNPDNCVDSRNCHWLR